MQQGAAAKDATIYKNANRCSKMKESCNRSTCSNLQMIEKGNRSTCYSLRMQRVQQYAIDAVYR